MIDGVAVLDKPAGLTSHDVVARVRRALGIRKVGHAGTLDPSATGVLVIGVGRGTRLLGFLTASPKVYEATIRLGAETDTDDADGSVRTVASAPSIADCTDTDIHAAVAHFIGTFDQVPSSVSAVKQGGIRAHTRVRAGEDVTLPPRTVTISELVIDQIRRNSDGIDLDVRIACSAGTYVRALARDLGRQLGVGGHVRRLHRTASGSFHQPTPLEDFLAHPAFVSLAQAVATVMPVVQVDAAATRAMAHGGALPWPRDVERGTIAFVGDDGALIAIAEPNGDSIEYRAVFAGDTP